MKKTYTKKHILKHFYYSTDSFKHRKHTLTAVRLNKREAELKVSSDSTKQVVKRWNWKQMLIRGQKTVSKHSSAVVLPKPQLHIIMQKKRTKNILFMVILTMPLGVILCVEVALL